MSEPGPSLPFTACYVLTGGAGSVYADMTAVSVLSLLPIHPRIPLTVSDSCRLPATCTRIPLPGMSAGRASPRGVRAALEAHAWEEAALAAVRRLVRQAGLGRMLGAPG